jgi:hypothetical protein
MGVFPGGGADQLIDDQSSPMETLVERLVLSFREFVTYVEIADYRLVLPHPRFIAPSVMSKAIFKIDALHDKITIDLFRVFSSHGNGTDKDVAFVSWIEPAIVLKKDTEGVKTYAEFIRMVRILDSAMNEHRLDSGEENSRRGPG